MVESYKSGFEPPGDVEFEDYGQAMKRTVSNTSLTNVKETKEKAGGKSKGKLWPFIKNKNKVTARGREGAHTRHRLVLASGPFGALDVYLFFKSPFFIIFFFFSIAKRFFPRGFC